MKANKINLIYWGLSCLMFLYSCKSEHKRIVKYEDVNLELTSYRDSIFNFSIEYPSEWKLIGPNEEVIFAVKKADDSQKFIHITLLMDTITNSVILSKIVEENYKDLSTTFDNFTVEEVKDLAVNKNTAIKVKCFFDANSTTIQSLLYFIKTSKRVYLVALSSNSNEFSKYEKIYEYIANTFQAE
jgi:hypothetical protein